MPIKYYVVWVGRETGIFSDWPRAQQAVHGFAGARYKSFSSRAEAEQAFKAGSGATYSSQPKRKVSASTSVNETPASYANQTFDVCIYCDGACEPNPGEAGSGIALYRSSQLTELWYGLYAPNGTNNSAELNALLQALIMAQREINDGYSVQILSDSQYSLNCIQTWAVGWEKKNWKRKEEGDIKNLEVIQAAYKVYTEIEDEVTLTHVAGHAGIEGNELADRMAVMAAQTKQVDFKQYEGELNIPALLKMKAG